MRLIGEQHFLDAPGNHPSSSHALVGALSEHLPDTLSLLAGLRHGTNKPRLTGLLAAITVEGPGAAEVTITQQELADLLGVTRTTANAALRELQRQRLIERVYGNIRIADSDALASFALT